MAKTKKRANPGVLAAGEPPPPTIEQVIDAAEDAQAAIDTAMGRQYAVLKEMRKAADGRPWTAAERLRLDAIYEEIDVLNRAYAEAGLALAIALNDSVAVRNLKNKIDATIDELKKKQARLEQIANGLSKAAGALNMMAQFVTMLAKFAAIV